MPNFDIIISAVTGKMNRKARSLAPTIEEYIASLSRAGMTPNAIRDFLLGPDGDRLIFGPIQRAFNTNMRDSLEQARQVAREEVFRKRLSKDREYRWQLGANTNHCPGCLDRAGWEPMVMKSWELVGTPRAAATECSSHCNCSLVPV